METVNIRDFAMYAAIFGVFAFAWFGWAQENPPQWLRPWLGVGSGLGAILAGIGGYLAYTQWDASSALAKAGAYETFGIIVVTECLLSLVGALALIKMHKQHLVAAWVAFVVAIHFVPLAFIFDDWWLHVLAGLIIAVVLFSQQISKRLRFELNTSVCLITAVILLVFAARGLLLYSS